MGRRDAKLILFLGTGDCVPGRFAELLFNAVAGRMGLPWKASARRLAAGPGPAAAGPATAAAAARALDALGARPAAGDLGPPESATAADLASASLVVALTGGDPRPLLAERFPGWGGTPEVWRTGDAPDPLPRVEQAVMGLVARLLGGGDRPGAAAPDPGPERPAAVRPAAKPVTVRVGRETAGRRGKGVTTVSDVPLGERGLRELAATLKQRCGTGGTVKGGRIEIQGDIRDRVAAELERLGYRVKRTGG